MPTRPATHSTPRQLEEAEEVFEIQEEVEKLVNASTIVDVGAKPRRNFEP